MIGHADAVYSLVGDLTPDVDAVRLAAAAGRYDDLAQRLSELRLALDGAVTVIADALGGQTSVALGIRAQDLADDRLTAAVARVQATADMVRAYADAVETTRQRLTVVAAIADRDLLTAQVMVAATGDTTTAAGAELAATRVMAAAAGELDRRTEQIVGDATDPAGTEPTSAHHASGMSTPMMPGAMMAPMGAALAGLAAHRAGNDLTFDTDLPAGDLRMLQDRAATLTATQPHEVAPWIRLAVGMGQDGDGRRVVVIGTSEPAGYLRPGVVPEPHEVVVGDGRAPEITIIDYFTARDLDPLAVCAVTPSPPEVAALVGESGALVVPAGDDGSDSGSGP